MAIRVPAAQFDQPESGSELEMPEDDETEPLGDTIDLAAIIHETLMLCLPDFPRKDGAALGDMQYAQEGVTPMRDEDARPFAGLADLRASLKDSTKD